ncbi:DUF4112 domain-containing protein [Sandarakinorhabdus sp.]|uniref:DUF4112 domain-containing protein n=1 Tax=Sandarakinorhabdus sp. TaxID=1916663 RepID=UPI00286E2982|nr:DUF4112 domain-containing protein [Sandarakinorhabdus sp.]
MTAPLIGQDTAAVRARIDLLERLLERSLTIPGTRIGLGLDSIIGLVPVAGDAVAGAIGLYLIWEGRNLGLSRWTLARMLANVGFDTALGSVPLAGDVFDFFFRSNSRNLRLIRRHLDRR